MQINLTNVDPQAPLASLPSSFADYAEVGVKGDLGVATVKSRFGVVRAQAEFAHTLDLLLWLSEKGVGFENVHFLNPAEVN